MKKIRNFLLSAYGPMVVVSLQYAVKAPLKIWVGYVAGLTAIVADGYHNSSDLAQGLIAIWLIRLLAAAATREFPLGKKNIASIFKVFVGISLGYLALTAGFQSLQVLWNVFVNHGVFPVRFDPQYATMALVVAVVSVAISIPVSEYQIRIGKRLNNGILVADGTETRSDAVLETVIAAGIIGQMIGGWAWIEYPLTLVVCVFMLQTARELLEDGLGALLQKSIGQDHETKIRGMVEDLYGVEGVDQLITFKVGPVVVLIMKVLSHYGAEVADVMKKAMALQIAEHLRSEGFEEGEFFIRFSHPDSDAHRRAVALAKEGETFKIVSMIDKITHLAVCDIEEGRVTRYSLESVQEPKSIHVVSLLREKHVREIVFRNPTAYVKELLGDMVIAGPSADLAVYDL